METSWHRLCGSVFVDWCSTYVRANPFDHLRTCFFPLLHVIIIFSQLDAAVQAVLHCKMMPAPAV
ncbi:hypothetical protein T4E_5694 [Trichinella pseudospiralis]|uniref:Uncharacterized protein n=1 Tax=Trichinella pseudospiralis TaxID=6337 RepID=A0A0V0XQZ9_TRIPS|nr:hypothetical protein T4E_5694 [Trichinella pseudospiralis]